MRNLSLRTLCGLIPLVLFETPNGVFETTPTPERFTVGNEHNQVWGADLVSGSSVQITHRHHWVTGTGAIDTMVLPWTTFSGKVTLTFAGAATWTAAGNIAVAGTAVANQSVEFVYRPAIGKWYPSKY